MITVSLKSAIIVISVVLIGAIRAGRKLLPSFRSEGLVDGGWRELIEVVRNRLQSHAEQ